MNSRAVSNSVKLCSVRAQTGSVEGSGRFRYPVDVTLIPWLNVSSSDALVLSLISSTPGDEFPGLLMTVPVLEPLALDSGLSPDV